MDGFCHVAVMTKYLKTFWEPLFHKPCHNLITTPQLSAVGITPSVDMVNGEKLRGGFATTRTYIPIMIKDFITKTLPVTLFCFIYYLSMTILVTCRDCEIGCSMVFSPLFHIGSMFGPIQRVSRFLSTPLSFSCSIHHSLL